jgi:uncharacterized protein YoxC
MSEMVPAQGKAPAPTDGDNRYKAVQQKLKSLAAAMDQATARLEVLRRHMQSNADRANALAVDIANAELDAVFVEMTSTVSVALGGAAVQVRRLHATAQEVSELAEGTKLSHSKLYEGLDEVRSSRRFRTPKPGFFVH